MNETQHHRGPDADGLHCEAGLGLGHKRLSIIDLSTGQQPLYNEDRSVVVIFNGEIYNYQELIPELTRLGHTFRTKSDTEVIVHAWEQWGEACVTRFRGMFAFALWDRGRETLFLARDRLGVKPLYYALLPDGMLVFGSELKALAAHPGLPRELDPLAIEEYFAFGYIPEPRTIYSGAHKLPPAHTLTVRRGQAMAQPREYWDVRFTLDNPIGEARRAGRARRAPAGVCAPAHDLRRAARRVSLRRRGLERRGRDDGGHQLGPGEHVLDFVHRSGVRRVALRGTGRAIATARATSSRAWTATTSIWSTCSPARTTSRMPTALRFRPTASASSPANTSRWRSPATAATKVSAVIAGIACMPWKSGCAQCCRYRFAARPSVCSAVYTRKPTGRRKCSARRQPSRHSREPRSTPISTACRSFPTTCEAGFIVRPSRLELGGYNAAEVFHRHAARASTDDALALVQYLDLKTYLVGDINTKVDRASMAHSLEVREPLMDHPLVEWLATVPSSLKLRVQEGKLLLKKAMQPHLPSEVLYRPKMGFAVPLARWFRGPLRPRVRAALLGTRLADTGYFNTACLEELAARHDSGARNYSSPIWALLMFDAFLRTVEAPRTDSELRAAVSA